MQDRLTRLGFTKRTAQIYTLDVGDNALGWLGLNRATEGRSKGEKEVNPTVGLRHQQVETIVAKCRRERFHRYLPPTVSSSLGYVMPERRYRSWILRDNGDDSASEMLTAIETYGISFMRSIRNVKELLKLLDSGQGLRHQTAYRRPVAAYVCGDIEGAVSRLTEEVDALGARDDAASREYRAYADELRAYMT